MEVWVLGSGFMENFYTVFDASDPTQLKIGLSTVNDYPTLTDRFSLFLGIAIVAATVIAFVTVCTLLYCRRRKAQRLEQAKTYFAQHKHTE